MHLREIDTRSTPLRVLCTTSTNAIAELVEFCKEGMMDGITAMEYAEYFYGAVLVACQAYAVGTVSDLNEIDGSKNNKLDLYKYRRPASQDHTLVELINALANYFKHNEEWAAWPSNETTKVLRYFGINESTEFPLETGVCAVIGDSPDL